MSPSRNNAPSMAPTDIGNPDAIQRLGGAGLLNKKIRRPREGTSGQPRPLVKIYPLADFVESEGKGL